MVPFLVVVLFALTLAVAVLADAQTDHRQLPSPHPADGLGLVPRSRTRWEGRLQGVDVVVHSPHARWTIDAEVPFAMPAGIDLGPGARHRDERLLRAAVASLVEPLEQRDLEVTIGPTVRLHGPPRATVMGDLEDALADAVGLVRALTEQHVRLVEAPRSRLRDVTIGPGGEVHGHHDDVPVRILGPRVGERFWSLQLRARLARPLPPETLVRAGRGHALGDMILDQALHVRSREPAALAGQLARDGVRGIVLDVLAAHPGSELRSDEVVHSVDDGALDVGAALDRVLALVRALER